jgi:hypothetical protein
MMWSQISKSHAAVERAHTDGEWFVPLTFIVLIETLLWCAAYQAGYAEKPVVATYGAIAVTFLVFVLSWKSAVLLNRERPEHAFRRLAEAAGENRERIVIAIWGSVLLAVGSAAFGSLKAGIPQVIPFWFDLPESRLEDWLFGGHPAVLIDPQVPWILPFLDRIYATFVGVHLFAVLGVLASQPSAKKSRAIVSLALAWLLIGVVTAYLCSSVGPIFYDRTYGGHKYAELTAILAQYAPITTFTANALWAIEQQHVPIIANGISAFPSMHVTLTCWLALVLNRTRFASLGWAYLFLIWVGSILLGWHWGLGGIAGASAMLGLWKLAPRLLYIQSTCAEPVPTPAPEPAGAEALTEQAAG